jgi:hypothetical protein
MIAITFTYDRDVVELIKVCVPNYARSWSLVRREWLIEDVYGKAATKYCTVTLLALIGTRASNRARLAPDPIRLVAQAFRIDRIDIGRRRA